MKYLKNKRNRANRSLGFTMLEVVVVLVVVGIMASLGVTSYKKTIERNRKENYTKAMASLFRKARQRAVAEGVPVYVGVYWGFLPTPNKIGLPGGSYDTLWAAVGNAGTDNFLSVDNNIVNNTPVGEVTEVLGLVHSPYGLRQYELQYSMYQFGEYYGCRLGTTPSTCMYGTGQAVIMPDGFVYGSTGVGGTPQIARFTVGINYYSGAGVLDRYSMVGLSNSGTVQVRY